MTEHDFSLFKPESEHEKSLIGDDLPNPPSHLVEAYRKEMTLATTIGGTITHKIYTEALQSTGATSLHQLEEMGLSPSREQIFQATLEELAKHSFPAIAAMEQWENQQIGEKKANKESE